MARDYSPHDKAILAIGEALGEVLNDGHHVPLSVCGTSVFVDGVGDVPLVE